MRQHDGGLLLFIFRLEAITGFRSPSASFLKEVPNAMRRRIALLLSRL